jgi:hypothetical protein
VSCAVSLAACPRSLWPMKSKRRRWGGTLRRPGSRAGGEWWTAVYPARRCRMANRSKTPRSKQILAVADRVAAQDAASAASAPGAPKATPMSAPASSPSTVCPSPGLEAHSSLSTPWRRPRAGSRRSTWTTRSSSADVAQEALDIARDAPIKAAYDRFLALLRGYRNQLPSTLMAGLNDAAMNLYNEFNRNDFGRRTSSSRCICP